MKLKNKYLFSTAMLLVGLLFTHCNPKEMTKSTDAKVSCTIELENSYSLSGKAEMEFSFLNEGAGDLKILHWNTFLEGYRGNFLTVLDEQGNEMDYMGIMAKRAEPKEEDYWLCKPGKKLSAKLDLFKGYKITKPGKYTVTFDRSLSLIQEGVKKSLSVKSKAYSFEVTP